MNFKLLLYLAGLAAAFNAGRAPSSDVQALAGTCSYPPGGSCAGVGACIAGGAIYCCSSSMRCGSQGRNICNTNGSGADCY